MNFLDKLMFWKKKDDVEQGFESAEEIKTEAELQPKHEEKKKIFYKCDKCKYKFSRNEGAEVIACPYCGSKESFYAVK